jgi:hypothetical protein
MSPSAAGPGQRARFGGLAVRAALLPALLACCLFAAPAAAHYRPLATEDLGILEQGSQQFELGAEFRKNEAFPYSGLSGDFWQAGNIGIQVPVGPDAEVWLRGGLFEKLTVHGRAVAPGSATVRLVDGAAKATGDFSLGTKLRLRRKAPGAPGIGFQVAVELPNTPDESGLGTDQLSVLGVLILEQTVAGIDLFANAGLAVMDMPTQLRAQKDKRVYGVGFATPLGGNCRLLGEVAGLAGSDAPGLEDHCRARLAVQSSGPKWAWDAGVVAGLERPDGDWGVSVGLTQWFGK